jgi:hypothetical protein
MHRYRNARFCLKTVIASQSESQVSQLDHTSKVLRGFLEAREDASAFLEPSDKSLDYIAIPVGILVEGHRTSISVFTSALAREHREKERAFIRPSMG